MCVCVRVCECVRREPSLQDRERAGELTAASDSCVINIRAGREGGREDGREREEERERETERERG